MDRELLIEIGVEELPAGWMPALTRQLADRLAARLTELRIAPMAAVETYSTPRRLTARVGKSAERREDLEETLSGPPVSAALDAQGKPTPAALGFAKKQGVGFEELSRVSTAKGEYLAYHKRQRGKSAVDALPDLLSGLLRDLSFPKQMHWDAKLDDGRGELLFGRPIRWLLFLYGGRVVPFTIGRAANAAGQQVLDVESGALTYGHRFLATSGRAGRSIKVRSFEEYQARLSEHFVVLRHEDRRDRIARELESHARRLNGRVHLKEHSALIEEVADLVEFPGVVAGFYNREFLALPQEVLTTTLVHHQHYFPVVTATGELKEAFLAVVNTQPSDERLIAKNAERVVTARLRDAKFFWETDRKTKLADRLDRLHTVVFHKKLAAPSYRDKAERIEALARTIAAAVRGAGLGAEAAARADAAAKAARLAKTDLVTDMVFEFPELQGAMGGIYAREEGLPEPVWKAIYYHYLPVGVEADAPPSRKDLGAGAATWAAVSLADKADTLVSLFGAGEKPTGSRDPFGLRRNAHGLLKVLVDLPELTGLDRAVTLSQVLGSADPGLQTFMLERLRYVLEQRGFDARNVRAVTHADTGALSPLIARRKLEVLPEFTSSRDFTQLATAFKRVRNIARELPANAQPDMSLLKEPAEVALLAELEQRQQTIAAAIAAGDYRRAFADAAKFGPPVDKFFTDVFVMVDDVALKTARLSLMKRLEQLILSLGDISEIVGAEQS